MSHYPLVIWAATRTGSTNLCATLGAENEPFQAGPPPSRLAWAYDAWRASGDIRAIEELVSQRTSFKHLPEEFDDGFNVVIAQSAVRNGYRHVHLVRLNELARLISLDVAGQLNAWWPHDAAERFAELQRGDRRLNPLDVERLIAVSETAHRSWSAVSPHLNVVLEVTLEALTTKHREKRYTVLGRLASFLELSRVRLMELDAAMFHGGQDTGQIRDLIPNVSELREALTS